MPAANGPVEQASRLLFCPQCFPGSARFQRAKRGILPRNLPPLAPGKDAGCPTRKMRALPGFAMHLTEKREISGVAVLLSINPSL
jgi:hypothetical protein